MDCHALYSCFLLRAVGVKKKEDNLRFFCFYLPITFSLNYRCDDERTVVLEGAFRMLSLRAVLMPFFSVTFYICTLLSQVDNVCQFAMSSSLSARLLSV